MVVILTVKTYIVAILPPVCGVGQRLDVFDIFLEISPFVLDVLSFSHAYGNKEIFYILCVVKNYKIHSNTFSVCH